ncbi:MAG: ribokinase [Kiritimatiellaeota bacterium]|nr:ribokinase [Kiritimatiellota bacterium]
MKILNIGSLNIDHVYHLPHPLRPGETLHATRYDRFPGGKGLNQSIALARAGASVSHAGAVGADGQFLRDLLRAEKINTAPLLTHPSEPTGHAVILVMPGGENTILLNPGANHTLAPGHFKKFLKPLHAGDTLLLQNEISNLFHLLHAAHDAGLRVILNPAPFTADLHRAPLNLLDTLIVNEIEARQLAELPGKAAPRDAFAALQKKFPDTTLILTLGPDGVMASMPRQKKPPFEIPAFPVKNVVDTTAAGDTFTGYYVAERLRAAPFPDALRFAAAAAALCCAKPGAAPSIPRRAEVEAAIQTC